MELPKNIVVALDFSTPSRNALREAMRLALWSGATVHAVSVVDAPGRAKGQSGAAGGDARHLSEQEVASRLDQFIAIARASSVALEKVVRTGDHFHELLQTVKRTSADLLVLGSRGAGHASTCLGHLSSSCLRRLPARVLVVRRTHTGPFQKVSAVIDFSAETDHVIQQSVAIARAEKAELKLCHIFLPPWRIVHYRAPTPHPSEEQKRAYNEPLIEKLQRALDPHRESLGDLKVGYSLVESSQNVIGIEEYVERSGADLVVVNTRGRVGLRRLLPCTRAEHIIRTSPCSVLAIKPKRFH